MGFLQNSLVALFLGAHLASLHAEPFSDPDKVRPWTITGEDLGNRLTNWHFQFEVQPELEEPDLPPEIGPVTRETTEEGLVVLTFDDRTVSPSELRAYSGGDEPYPKGMYLPFQVIEAGPDMVARLPGDEAVKLATVGLAWNDNATRLRAKNNEVPYQFSSPETGMPLSSADLNALAESKHPVNGLPESFRKVHTSQLERSPLLNAIFQTSHGESLQWESGRLYDLRTHQERGFGSSRGRGLNQRLFSTVYGVDVRHDTALRLVQDVHANPQDFDFDMKPGHQIVIGDRIRVQLLAVESGSPKRPHLDHKDQPGTKIYRLEPGKVTKFEFNVDPPIYNRSLNLLVQMKDGEETAKSLSSGLVFEDLENIQSIRIRWFSGRYRLIYDVPKVAGMPNPRSEVDNLFDIRLYDLKVRNERILRDTMVDAVQFQWDPHVIGRADFPEGFFPKTWGTVTPRELLARYQEYWKGDPFILDSEACSFRRVWENP